MGSSSDLEFVAAPSASSAPEPVKPRVSGRTRRAPRGKDELAAPAAPILSRPSKIPIRKPAKSKAILSEEGDDETLAPSINNQPLPVLPVASTSRDTLPNLPVLPVIPSVSIPTSASAPSLSTSSKPPKSSASPSAPAPAPAPLPVPRRASTDSAPTRPPSKGRSITPKPARKPLAKPPGGDSSDEADDFFNRATKPVTTGRVPKIATGRVPGGGGGGGGGRVPKGSISRSSATPVSTSPPKAQPKQRKFVPSSSSSSGSDSDTSKSSALGAAHATTYSSDVEPMTKDINLPAWARGGAKGGHPGMSGADLAKQQKGYQRNRKRRRLSQDSEEEKRDMEKGKGKGKMIDLSEEEEEDGQGSDDSLEISFGALPRTKSKTISPQRGPNRAKRPGMRISLEDDDDEKEEEENAGGRRVSATRAISDDFEGNDTPKPKPPSPPKLSAAQLLLESARGLHVATSPVKSPRQVNPTRETTTITLGSSSDNEDSFAGLDPALAAIRAGLRRPTNHDDSDFEIVRGGTPSSRTAPTGRDSLNGTVTISLRMTFDPTLTSASDAVKRAYEKEEKFELRVNQAFSDLFDLLSAKRYLNRNNLVITYERSQLYDFGTPKSLRLSAGSLAEMRAYTRDVWEKTQRIERERKARGESESLGAGKRLGLEQDDEGEDDFSALERAAAAAREGSSLQPPGGEQSGRHSRSPSAQPSTSENSNKELFRLTVRGSKTQSIDLAVKYTTTMQSLVKAYARQHGITDQAKISKMFIEIEGDKIDPTRTIEDIKEEFGLEDEETIDLRGAA